MQIRAATVFIIATGLSLFLPDGKQAGIEVYWAGILSLLFFLAWRKRKKLNAMPRWLLLAWGAVLAGHILSSFFSASLGYSVNSLLRLMIGFASFSLFFAISSPRVAKHFTNGLLAIAALASSTSVLLLLFPTIAQHLPAMNLIFSRSGHNRVVYLLVLAFPLVLSHPFLLILSAIAISLSFSRGAWLVLIGYILVASLRAAKQPLRTVLYAVLLLFSTLLVTTQAISLLPNEAKENLTLPAVVRHLTLKYTPVEELRPAYWQQALKGLSDRPLWGSGPGTFPLVSRRFQEKPNTSSWFAHSFPLQTLAELGILGSIPLFLLFFLLIRHIFRRKWSPGLLDGVLLTLLYSMFETNLDHLPILVLLWSSLGLLAGFQSGSQHAASRTSAWRGVILSTAILVVFSGISLVGALLWQRGQFSASFSLTPFLTQRTESYFLLLDDTGRLASPREGKLAELFHRENPDILMQLARIGEKTREYNVAKEYYDRAVKGDQLNLLLLRKYLSFLLDQKDDKEAGRIFSSLVARVVAAVPITEELPSIDFQRPTTIHGLAENINLLSSNGDPPMTLAKLLYVLGLDTLTADPETTRRLWQTARLLSPQWEYFHTELAGLSYYIFKDQITAKQILTDCQKYEYPAVSCRFYGQDVHRLKTPGHWREHVLSIPRIIE